MTASSAAGIRAWVAKEIVGGRYDGTYDKSNLPPGDLILTNYVRVRDGKIVEMVIVRVA